MEKKSIARNILGLFVSMEDDQPVAAKTHQNAGTVPPKSEAVVSKKTVVAPVPPAAGTTVSPVQSSSVPVVDPKIATALAQALEQNNLDGFDYFEFAKMIDALKATIPVEATLYQSAFASATVMGASKESIMQSAQHYIQVLERKASEFGEAVGDQYKIGVDGKIKESQDIELLIKEKAELIQKITEEINQLSKRKELLIAEVEESRKKIEAVKQNYEITWSTFNSRIRVDIDNITKYIG